MIWGVFALAAVVCGVVYWARRKERHAGRHEQAAAANYVCSRCDEHDCICDRQDTQA